MELYNILEINTNASYNEIRKSYHRLIKIYHPDKNKSSDASEKFQKIQSAYEILINEHTRTEYQQMNYIVDVDLCVCSILGYVNMYEFSLFLYYFKFFVV